MPPSLGFEPRINRYAEFHRRLLHAGEHDNDFVLGGEVLDLVARELLAGFFNQIRMPHGIGEFLDRLAGGGSLSSVLSELIAHGPSTVPPEQRTALLGTLSADAWVAAAGAWPSAEFVRHPRCAGAPAETGPLARHAASPLVRILLERGNRISARLFANAIDVADCASTMRHPGSEEVAPLIDAWQAAPGVGMARVITARGGGGWEGVGAAIFLLVDQPQITTSILQALTEKHAEGLYPIVAPMVMDRRANPVLFDRRTFADPLTLEGDTGGRAIFHKHKVEYLPWHDDRLLLDVDTPEHYQRLLADETL